MRVGKYILLLLLTFRIESTFAQSSSGKTEVWQFMVRNAMRMDDIGVRFNTDVREVKKLSKVSGKIVMPGTVLFIPVKLRPVTWDPSNFNPNEIVLPKEVMKPKKDYELDFSIIDPEILNEFIIVEDMFSDSIQIQKMTKHIGRIDKTIKQLEYSLDSLKKAEFAFDYDESDQNSVLKKMEMARQRFYRQGPAGKEIDSLKALRAKLGQEINKMNSRINDYDFLRENQYYFSKKKSPITYAETQIIPAWGEQIKAETKYMQSKAQPSVRQPEQEMAKAQSPPPKEEPVVQSNPPSKAESITKTKPQEIVPIVEQKAVTESKPNIQENIAVKAEVKTSQNAVDEVKTAVSEKTANLVEMPVAIQEKAQSDELESNKVEEEKQEEDVRDDDLVGLYEELDSMESKSDYSPKYFGEMPSTTSSKAAATKSSIASSTSKPAKEANENSNQPNSQQAVNESRKGLETKSDVEFIEFEERVASESEGQVIKAQSESKIKTDKAVSDEEVVDSRSSAQRAADKTKNINASGNQKSIQSESDDDVRLSTKQPKQESKAISTLAEEKKDVAINEESSSIDVSDVKVKDKVVKKVVTVDEIFEKGLVNLTPADVSLARVTQTKETPRYLTPSDSISVQRATESFKRFEDLMRAKDYKRALLMLERAIEYDPNNCDYWSYHADFLISAGKELDAMRELNIAIKINPDKPKQLFKIAKLYDRTNNFDRAFEYYTYTIMSDYTFWDAYYERADLAIRQNDRKSAIADYDKLLNVNKNASRAYLERGTLRMAERNFEGAVEDFNSYFDIEDPQGATMYKRGIAKIFMGKIIDGCEDFKISLDLGYIDADKAVKKYCQ